MRRAHVLRISSTHDVCIFCATRKRAADGAHPVLCSSLSARPQRRNLNSSSKASQDAEVLVYREERQRPRILTPQEKMRQQLLSQYSPPPPAPTRQQNDAISAPPPRQRPSLVSHSLQQSYARPRRVENQEILPRARAPVEDQPKFDTRLRFRANLDVRPSLMDMPEFGLTGNLRRRNHPRSNDTSSSLGGQEQSRPARLAPRRKLDQGELDRLLGNNSTRQPEKPRQYTPLAKNDRTVRCFECGQIGHMSLDCPRQPVSRHQSAKIQRQSTGIDRSTGSLAITAEEWLQKEEKNIASRTQQSLHEEEVRRRRIDDKKRNRFRLENEELASHNRYENPEPRRRGGTSRVPRGRAIRDDNDEDDFDRAEIRRQRRDAKEARKKALLERSAPMPLYLPEYISVANLAGMLKLRVEEFVRKLEELGFEAVQNDHILNAEHAGLIAQEYNFEPIIQAEEANADLHPAEPLTPEEYSKLPARPPVVTIMGHVDHGKTTILDYMRSTSVATNEFGGITQHIGAFSVPLTSGKKITFLDTPGHAAFETMRARGANVTDIVVLVIAADDSVMPQTVEAIKHAQAAQVPLIVAINKIDKPQADPERVKQDLARNGIEVEDFGGETQVVCVSGKTGQGIPDLEDAISLLSEVLDHRADPKAKVEGWVLEGSTKKAGRAATILVRNGTLRPGDILVAGTTWARVRTLRNEAGVIVQETGPGMPVEVDGWRDQPIAGDEALQAEDEQQATRVTEHRISKVESRQMAQDVEAINQTRRLEAERRAAEDPDAPEDPSTHTNFNVNQQNGGLEIIPFIIKADVSGSAEAVVNSVSAIGNNEVGTRILRSSVGPPSEFDVQHAADAQGHIINFNTVVAPNIAALAEEKGVKILDSNIIYRVVENVKELLSEKLAPKITQRVTGEAEIAAIFEIGLGGRKKMKVAGSKVRNGAVTKGAKARVFRKDEVIFDGTLSSLKNLKKDVHEMRKDTECGIAFEGWENFGVGDKIQCYEEKKEKRRL
ncbi:initiation factor 2 [Lojkania enalia]|uniref:Translation initiation factor IF-2, mitochondrial n=1 Tax=Lojkania enalia TaxID=147567 RepID=A0A9P4N3E9_9PLEO|nr:initiation factor 2 [Didymosphaeria enalia]